MFDFWVFSLTNKTIVGDNQCQAYNWDFISLNNIRRRLWEERHPDWQHFLFRGTLGMYLHACYLRNSARSRAPKHFRHLVAQPNTVRQRWLAIIYTSEHLTHWFHSRDCQKPEASVNSSFLTRKLRKCGESEKKRVTDRERIHSTLLELHRLISWLSKSIADLLFIADHPDKINI